MKKQPQPVVLTHVCTKCETAFTFETPDTPAKRWMMYGTCVVLGFMALSAFSLKNHGVGIVLVALIAVRFWLYLRSITPRCTACRSSDCVGADTPVGRRIITGKI